MNTLRKFLAVTASSALLLSASSAWADTATDNLDISITIAPACTLDSVDDVAANHATGTTGAQSQSGSVRVTCNTGHAYTLAMGAGLNADASFQRRVHDGTNHIAYDLVKQASGAIWGTTGTAADNSMDGAGGGVNDQNGTGSGAQQVWGYQINYTLAGTEAAGTYTDSVLVTLEF